MYKAFVRPHLDYGDILYDDAYNETFHQKPEAVQYNVCLGSRRKLYHELGLESLQLRHRHKKLCLIYKIFKENKHIYLFNLIPTKNLNYNTRNTEKSTLFHTKYSFFRKIISTHSY